MDLFECCGGRRSSSPALQEDKRAVEGFQSATKILLLGTGESGKSTILKQMKVLHVQGFDDKDRAEQVAIIRSNLQESVLEIVRNVDRLGLSFESEQSKKYAQTLLTRSDVVSENYVDLVQTMLGDSGFLTCLQRSNEYQLIDNAAYFLTRLVDICSPNYSPTTDDMLRSRKLTTGYNEVRFKIRIPKSSSYQEFRMFDVGGQREERRKWIHVFGGIEAVLFLVSCCDYDQTLREDGATNRLTESMQLFNRVWHNKLLTGTGLICFLNKQDLLEEKIRRGHLIGYYFPEYSDFRSSTCKRATYSRSTDPIKIECDHTRSFIKEKLIMVTQEPPRRMSNREFAQRDCYYHFTTATDSENIRKVFDDVQAMILKEMVCKFGLL